jgi:hypothetical protein
MLDASPAPPPQTAPRIGARAREVAAFVLALAGTAALGWLVAARPAGPVDLAALYAGAGGGVIRDELAGGWESVDVMVGGAVDAALVERLDAALAGAARWGELRQSSGAPRFLPTDGKAYATVPVDADDWDAALVLNALRAVSAALPAVHFEVLLEPQGRLPLEAGRFGEADPRVLEFTARMAKPRPVLEGVFTHLEVTVTAPPSTAAAIQKALEDALAAMGALGVPVPRFERVVEGLRIEASLDGRVRPLVTLIEQIGAVATRGGMVSPATVRLDGATPWERTLDDAGDWVLLSRDLRVGAGPLKDATP